MQKLVTIQENNTVSLADITDFSVIGIRLENCKGFLVRSPWSARISVTAVEGFHRGNHYVNVTGGSESTGMLCSTRKMVERLIANHFVVYQFDTEKELFAWLAE